MTQNQKYFFMAHISEDNIKLIIDVESAKAQQEIHKLEKLNRSLDTENKKRLNTMIQLESQGKKETEAYRNLQKTYKETSAKISENSNKIVENTKKVGISHLTMSQLRKEAKQLQRQLDNTSKTLNPESYNKLAKSLTDVKSRMRELSFSAAKFKEDLFDKNTISFIEGTLVVKTLELIGKGLAHAVGSIREAISSSMELAQAADGVSNAFNKIDRHDDILAGLRKATKETVSDFELMKATVQARDFNIPLQDLGKYLQFAQLKAQETGQSVEYMTQSIVTGLGRKSVMILDNLGISAAEVNAKVSETGDFMKAVAEIVDKNLAEAGETYISAADRANQRAVQLTNAQMALGQALLPLKEKWEDTYGAMQISTLNTIAAIVKHRAVLKALAVMVATFTIAMVALNAQIRTYIAQTTIAKAVTLGWSTAMNTLRGLMLLVGAAFNILRANGTKATAMMRLFNKTCKANVFLFLASAAIAAGTALYAYYKKTEQAKNATDDFRKFHAKLADDLKAQENEIKKATKDRVTEQITKVKQLRATIQDANKTYAERKKAIQQLLSIVPDYHASLSGEGKLFNSNSAAIDKYISKLMKAAEAEVAYEKIKENTRKIMDAQERLDENKRKINNVKTNTLNKQGVNLDEWSLQGDKMTSDNQSGVIREGNMLNSTEEKAWAAQTIANKRWVESRQKVVDQDQAIVDQYTAQNMRLQSLIEKNGGTGQAILDSTYDTTGSTGGSTDKDSKAIQELQTQRQEQMALLQRDYQTQLNILKKSLADGSIAQETYNAMVLQAKIDNQQDIVDVEKEFLDQTAQLQLEDNNKKLAAQKQQEQNLLQAQLAQNNAQLEQYQAFYQQMDKIGKMYPVQLTDEQELELQKSVLEGYYQAALQMAGENTEQRAALEQAYKDAQERIENDFRTKQLQKEKELEQSRLQIRMEYGLATLDEQYAAELEKLKEHLANKLQSEKDYADAVKALEREKEDQMFQVREQYGLVSDVELYQRKREQLQLQYEQGLIDEEDYNKAKMMMGAEYAKQQFDNYKSMFSDAVNALQQAEMDNVDAKYDAEIEAARAAGKDTTELENKKANEKLKIEKKYADVQFAIKASTIIADTAMAIMQAFSQLGPIGGAIAAALMTVTGAAQLASANAERKKVKKMTLNGAGSSSSGGARVASGRESGGYLDVEREQDGHHYRAKYDPARRGFIDRPTVLVGEGPMGHSREWVASNAAVENPTVAPLLNLLDQAQRMGTIRTLDMNKLLQRQMIARAAGGDFSFSNPSSVASSAPTYSSDAVLERLTIALERLETDGIPASVALTELEQKQELRNRARKIAQR